MQRASSFSFCLYASTFHSANIFREAFHNKLYLWKFTFEVICPKIMWSNCYRGNVMLSHLNVECDLENIIKRETQDRYCDVALLHRWPSGNCNKEIAESH